MNLKDWQAMSPEEQQAYWDGATLDERRELVDQGLSWEELAHPGIEFTSKELEEVKRREAAGYYERAQAGEYKPRPLPTDPEAFAERILAQQKMETAQEKLGKSRARCCYLRDTLIKQLKDEDEGVIFYSQMAGEIGIIGENTLAEVLNHISDDEFKHYLELRGIIDILTEQCNCERKTLGPPFG